MASIGANYASLYVQQKRQEEKMKRKEEERARKNGGEMGKKSNISADDVESSTNKSNKVHPAAAGGFGSPSTD